MELIYKELSEQIIGAAMTVLNTLRPGLDEKHCERDIIILYVQSMRSVVRVS